jgi:prepilin-type processing-associated H-X9-DG protein
MLDPNPPVLRRSSYFLNAWMAGGNGYCNLAATKSPASVIYVSESLEGITRDHFHPFNWIVETPPNPLFSGFMHMATFDDGKAWTKELALNRHSGGFNNVYLDGHSKWGKWTQLWWQKPDEGIWDGAFDPRQP